MCQSTENNQIKQILIWVKEGVKEGVKESRGNASLTPPQNTNVARQEQCGDVSSATGNTYTPLQSFKPEQYKMSTNRQIDTNGFMLIKGCPLSSFGIFDYSAGQLGLPGDPMRIVKVFRPESAVSDPAALSSMMNIPLIDDHEMLSGLQGDDSATAPEEYGVDGILTSDVRYESPWMLGDLKIFSRTMKDALDSGKKDLSLGYSCDFEVKPGVWNGQPYEVVQTNMRGNHIALVQEGRVPGARVLDGLCFDHLSFLRPSDKEIAMPKRNKATMDNAVEQLKALLPALQQFLKEEATEPAHQDPAAGEESAEEDAVTDPSSDPATNPAAADPEAQPADPDAAGGDELTQLVTQVKAMLAKIEALTAGGATETADEDGDEDAEATDNVEGLATNSEGTTGAAVGSTGENNGEPGKASPGPKAGSNSSAKDAAVRNFYSDLAAKTGIYDRLSKVVGAFAHTSMDARAVAAYGVKKLKLKAADGQEFLVLDAYLSGVENQRSSQKPVVRHAADAMPSSDELDAFLKGN